MQRAGEDDTDEIGGKENDDDVIGGEFAVDVCATPNGAEARLFIHPFEAREEEAGGGS